MLVCRGAASLDIYDQAFSTARIRLPIAPSLGLLLDRVHFRAYDLKCAQAAADAIKHGRLEEVKQTMEDAYAQCDKERVEFKEQAIYTYICRKELVTQSCWSWLHWINDLTYWAQPHNDLVDTRPPAVKFKRSRAESDKAAQAAMAQASHGAYSYTSVANLDNATTNTTTASTATTTTTTTTAAAAAAAGTEPTTSSAASEDSSTPTSTSASTKAE